MPAGFRWIAVRPGPPPPPRRRRRPLGPTPRYQSIPRWGLVDQIATAPVEEPTARRRATSGAVQSVLLVTAAVFALAAATHVVRYLLMLINRTTLLPPFVALGSLITGVLASLAAIVMVGVTAVVLTSWLIGRRADAFAAHGQDDPRPEWTLWLGCLVPVVNWVFAPLFCLELAQAERCRERQNRPIALWAVAWIITSLICAWATWTSLRAHEPQAVADNTMTVIIAYLAGLAVIVLLWQVVEGFIRRPVTRELHRWVVVPGAESEPPAEADEVVEVDEAEPSRDREPVA